MKYLRVYDKETLVNALYVLSSGPQGLEDLMAKLVMTKEQVLVFAQELIIELLATFKYPSMNSYVKYRQTIKAKELAERAVVLKEKRHEKALEAF